MIAARRPRRSGITLTEILIAILIMGVGLISLATLFPLGLIRLREGTRQGRAGTTFETAADDMDARALLYKPTFTRTWYGERDPFVQDIYPSGYTPGSNGYYNRNNQGTGVLASGNLIQTGNNVGLTSGLPICYDPLWRAITGVVPPLPNNSGTETIGTTLYDPSLDFQKGYFTAFDEARFGSGLFAGGTPYIDADPNGGGTSLVSAHGLQRLTNFIPWSNVNGSSNATYAFTYNNPSFNITQPPDVAGNVFTSVDDIVFNPTSGGTNVFNAAGVATSASPLVPDMTLGGGPQADYRFTWFFTGRQVDANGNGSQFTGEVVVCDGRPFGFDPLPNVNASAPAGESVVEAIFGLGTGSSIVPSPLNNAVGYAVNDRSVRLRWRNTMADPQVRVGGWIADVTYERMVPVYQARVLNTQTSFARCYWYQIAKRGDPTADPNDSSNFRTMVVTLTAPVRIKTLLNISDGTPYHRNVALIMPSVVNVFARTFEVH